MVSIRPGISNEEERQIKSGLIDVSLKLLLKMHTHF